MLQADNTLLLDSFSPRYSHPTLPVRNPQKIPTQQRRSIGVGRRKRGRKVNDDEHIIREFSSDKRYNDLERETV